MSREGSGESGLRPRVIIDFPAKVTRECFHQDVRRMRGIHRGMMFKFVLAKYLSNNIIPVRWV